MHDRFGWVFPFKKCISYLITGFPYASHAWDFDFEFAQRGTNAQQLENKIHMPKSQNVNTGWLDIFDLILIFYSERRTFNPNRTTSSKNPIMRTMNNNIIMVIRRTHRHDEPLNILWSWWSWMTMPRMPHLKISLKIKISVSERHEKKNPSEE